MPDFVGRSGPAYRAALLVRSEKSPALAARRQPAQPLDLADEVQIEPHPGVARQRTEVAVGEVRAGMADLARQEAGCQQRGIAAPGKALVCCSRLEALAFGDGHQAAVHEQAGSGVMAEAVDPGDRCHARPRSYGLHVCLQGLALPACSQTLDQQCLCLETSRLACHLRKSSNTAISFPADFYASGQLHAVKITVRSSVNVSIGYRPPTRPMPLAVPAPPPNGRWLSQWLVVTLMLTMPLRTFSA